MTGGLDADLRATAVELADELGKQITHVRITQSYDPTTGQTTETETTESVNAVPPQELDLSRVDGSLIQTGDTFVGLPAPSVSQVPSSNDSIRFDGDTWSVVRVQPIYSGEKVALYRVQLRE